jgi:hypothetical protein
MVEYEVCDPEPIMREALGTAAPAVPAAASDRLATPMEAAASATAPRRLNSERNMKCLLSVVDG